MMGGSSAPPRRPREASPLGGRAMIQSARVVTVDPTTGENMDSYSPMGPADLAEILRRTHGAFSAWKDVSFGERAGPMRELARLLREGAEAHARQMAIEMGKPIVQG